ncbi:type II toxin-antitoxin system RelB/DinJ family antitoxin [Desulfovibrio sp. OttesenSCG-928-G11]|nr:type II toxin-antitoxin system RelB/DinJ family antitoxin [Desulfovibrio sp. OttesenSCG-928-G11]
MSGHTIVQASIDDATMAQVIDVLDKKGISVSEAMGIFLRQIAYEQDFEIPHIPNALTAETLNKSERNEEVHKAADLADLMRQLEND